MKNELLTRPERIAGGIVGLLVGDALGVPYEFHHPSDLPRKELLEFEPPPEFDRAHESVPPGTWSDDGAQALCLLASLLECGQFNAADFAERLVRWRDQGYLAVDGRVFDVGITTDRAINALLHGSPPLEAGPVGARDNGNGALMRVLPLALWHQGSDVELVRDAQLQSRVTHGHLRSQLCCAFYCLWARRVLADAANPWNDAMHTLREILAPTRAALLELEVEINPGAVVIGKGSGYVVDCLHSARMALEESSFEAVVQTAVAIGNDTDTTACVAGGIAGVRYGLQDIPIRWRKKLRGVELLTPLLNQLLALTGSKLDSIC